MTITEIEDLIQYIKSNDPKKKGFPWDDVFASMQKTPEQVEVTEKKCPECGQALLQLYFKSPDWTWEKLCGRAGPLTICPHCALQVEFRLYIMS